MSDGNLADDAWDPLDDTAASVTQPKGEARIAQPLTAKPVEKRTWWMWIAGAVLGVLLLVEGIPRIITGFRTVSTDDAYVNGHVTFVAPRVPGQVVRVLVDDNNRVRASSLAYFDVFSFSAAVGLTLVFFILLMRRSVAEKGALIGGE